jgi:phosphate starvation-inducible PhoH-like protein
MPKPSLSRQPPAKFQWEYRGLKQEALSKAILSHTVTFASGVAGTGKTAVSVFTALDLLDKGVRNGGIDRIVVTRPLVTVGSDFGFLPGDLKDKIDPFLRPVFDLVKESDHPKTQDWLYGDHSPLEGLAVEMMRGMTFHNCLVLVDEAQNLKHSQMQMLLTRVGENCRMVFTGDESQIDLKTGQSGFEHAMKILDGNDKVEHVHFTVDDVVRSDFVGDVIRAYADNPPPKGKA